MGPDGRMISFFSTNEGKVTSCLPVIPRSKRGLVAVTVGCTVMEIRKAIKVLMSIQGRSR